MKRVNFRAIKVITLYSFFGGILGYLLLHPVSMFIHNNLVSWSVYRGAFLFNHLPMAIYFIILGALFGSTYGFYGLRIDRLYENVKVLSLVDDLTSLYNRRYLIRELEKTKERAQRYSNQFSLLMIDIDDFKQYNDMFGHGYGDNLLRIFAKHLKNFVRKSDTVARYGGEEFTVILPEAGKDEAIKMADRLRKSVESYPFPYDDTYSKANITISLGVTEFTDENQGVTELINKADSALYEAKREGKNRVCSN